MLSRRKFNIAFTTLPIAMAAGGIRAAHAAENVIMRVATWGSPEQSVIKVFVSTLADYVKEHSDGRIEVRHFPSGQLAQDSDMPVAIPTGRVDVGETTMALWSGTIPDVNIASAPTGLTMEQFANATDAPNGIKEVLARQFEAKNTRLFAIIDLGAVAIVSRKPITTPADLKDVRIRVYSEGTARIFQQLGAAPLQIPFADVYSSLQKGMIDAAVVGFQGVDSQRLYEVCDYLLVPATFVGSALMGYAGNLDWWNSLSDGDREVISAGMAVAEIEAREAVIADLGSLGANYTQEGMTVAYLEAGSEATAAWMDAMAPIMKEFEATLSPEILAPVREQIK